MAANTVVCVYVCVDVVSIFLSDAVGWVVLPVKIVSVMTYNVSSGTLSLCTLTPTF